MKQRNFLFLCGLCILCLLSAESQAQQQYIINDTVKTDSSDKEVYKKLLKMDFSNYVGKKTVGRFLSDIGRPYKEYTYSTSRPYYLQFIYFAYSEKLWVEIEVKEYKHVAMWNTNSNWDVEKFKKEIISVIRVKYNSECVKCLPIDAK